MNVRAQLDRLERELGRATERSPEHSVALTNVVAADPQCATLAAALADMLPADLPRGPAGVDWIVDDEATHRVANELARRLANSTAPDAAQE